jgi:hypothetical protein
LKLTSYFFTLIETCGFDDQAKRTRPKIDDQVVQTKPPIHLRTPISSGTRINISHQNINRNTHEELDSAVSGIFQSGRSEQISMLEDDTEIEHKSNFEDISDERRL